MTVLSELLAAGRFASPHAPWPRVDVHEDIWKQARVGLADGALTLLSVWADVGRVHMALIGDDTAHVGVLTLACPDQRYPAIGSMHPPAIRLERAIRDLFGIEPVGLPDTRPWLDHGRWTDERAPAAADYPFLPVEGASLHQIPVGPVHAGIIEPGHFRFTADGETIVRLEQRLGYVHKGIDSLTRDVPIERAHRIASRTSGDSTVAYGLGFSRAVEAALGVTVPERAARLRGVMAEMERIANHLGDFGAICNDASVAVILARCAVLRERVLRYAASCFGHRLMMDRIEPGGVAADIDASQAAAILSLLDDIAGGLNPLLKLYDNLASLQDRTVTTGHLRPELARRFGAGGYVGRASGRDFDSRRSPGYAPYDTLSFVVPTRLEGDVNARVWIRLEEIGQSLSMIQQLLRDLPPGPVQAPLPKGGSGEGMALVEAFRGDLLAWVRIVDGQVARCHLRDASWFQWPLLEAVVEGNIVADFPLCNKSFNCSYSGHDL